MASNTKTGEQRWAPARRGGMTVLGKVTVPKPINLPSQRLENRGLDPNVEIVPKGTLGWGSRSSAGTNAWSMLALSPSTEGSSFSTSQLSGRPSSSGGDSNVNAWSSNSRPSSASGSSTSNKVPLTSLRPRSAEARPCSSQLSRFAEPSPECRAWDSGATSERIGLSNSGEDGFSLRSRDFPTLGSEKAESRTNAEPLDGILSNADSKDTWKKEGPSYEDGPRPRIERCDEEPHPYQNPSSAPHYESWRGAPPVNPAGLMWYRGPPGPPPYGAPSDFPMKSFPYYSPLVPAPSLANSHVVPARGVGRHGHHAANGDMYRPHIPQSYMHPGMPVWPGFYPPPVPYEGCYGPPMGLCNPSGRDLSYMGVPTGHPVYNRPVSPNVPDPKRSYSRPGEVGAPDQADTYPHVPHENSKFLRKQNDEQRWGHKGRCSSNLEKGILSKAPIQDNSWGDDYKKDDDMHFQKNAPAKKAHSRSIESKVGSSIPSNVMIPGHVSNVEDTDLTSVVENVPSPADHSSIHTIEGLHAKACSPEGIQNGNDDHNGMKIINSKANRSANDMNLNIVSERQFPSGVLDPVSRDISIASVDRSSEITATSRKLACGAQSRGNHGKVSFNRQESDGWRKRSESHTVVSPAGLGSIIKKQVVEHHAPLYPAEVLEPDVKKGDGESGMPRFDRRDSQRAKMKEIAQQRSLQLQVEEEERIRDQKAKAFAKLEELNQCSANQAEENPGCKPDNVLPQNAALLEQEGPRNHMELRFGANHCTNTILSSATNFVPANEIGVCDTSDSTVLYMQARAETVKSTCQDSSSLQNQLSTTNVNVDDAADQGIATPDYEASMQKRVNSSESKDHTDSAGCEVADCVVASGAGKELVETPVHQKKNKNKLEDFPTVVPNESNNAKVISGTEEDNISNLNIMSSSIQSTTVKDVTHTSENHSSLSHEDAHTRQNDSWKPQHSRKPRSSQGSRSEKSHNSDAVVWAPVRQHNKAEVIDQTNQKAVDECSALSVAGNNVVINSPKSKRAEMERYVPKPVVKEIAQQGSIEQSPSAPVDRAEINGMGRRMKAFQVSDYLSKVGSYVDSKHVDGKRKQKAQESRLGSAKSVSVQVSHDNSAVVTGKNVKSNEILGIGPKVVACDDGWNSPNDSDFSSSAAFVGGKDNVHSGRRKRHSFKGHKGTDSNMNLDCKGSKADSNELTHPPIETSQTETTMPSKESREVGEHAMSQWKPKTQGFVAHDREGNMSHNHQNPIAEGTNKAMKREVDHGGASYKLPCDNQGVARDPGASEGRDVGGGISSLRHHENKMDMSVASVRGHAASSNPGFFGEVPSEQFPSSAYRKNANHSGHLKQGPQSREDWNSTGQENKQHYLSGNRERQRPNAHFEYQPVDSYNRSSSQPNDHGAQIENQSGGRKFRERGQSHARRGRGNFYGRQRGTPADAGNEK